MIVYPEGIDPERPAAATTRLGCHVTLMTLPPSATISLKRFCRVTGSSSLWVTLYRISAID
jgi:hypothetical protein